MRNNRWYLRTRSFPPALISHVVTSLSQRDPASRTMEMLRSDLISCLVMHKTVQQRFSWPQRFSFYCDFKRRLINSNQSFFVVFFIHTSRSLMIDCVVIVVWTIRACVFCEIFLVSAWKSHHFVFLPTFMTNTSSFLILNLHLFSADYLLLDEAFWDLRLPETPSRCLPTFPSRPPAFPRLVNLVSLR